MKNPQKFMSAVLIVCGYMACVPVVNAEDYQMQATVSAYAFRDINDQGSHGRDFDGARVLYMVNDGLLLRLGTDREEFDSTHQYSD